MPEKLGCLKPAKSMVFVIMGRCGSRRCSEFKIGLYILSSRKCIVSNPGLDEEIILNPFAVWLVHTWRPRMCIAFASLRVEVNSPQVQYNLCILGGRGGQYANQCLRWIMLLTWRPRCVVDRVGIVDEGSHSRLVCRIDLCLFSGHALHWLVFITPPSYRTLLLIHI